MSFIVSNVRVCYVLYLNQNVGSKASLTECIRVFDWGDYFTR